jgi:hypothetical protein
VDMSRDSAKTVDTAETVDTRQRTAPSTSTEEGEVDLSDTVKPEVKASPSLIECVLSSNVFSESE